VNNMRETGVWPMPTGQLYYFNNEQIGGLFAASLSKTVESRFIKITINKIYMGPKGKKAKKYRHNLTKKVRPFLSRRHGA
jgi:hypothetical protein